MPPSLCQMSMGLCDGLPYHNSVKVPQSCLLSQAFETQRRILGCMVMVRHFKSPGTTSLLVRLAAVVLAAAIQSPKDVARHVSSLMHGGNTAGARSRVVKSCERAQLQAQYEMAACSVICKASAMAGGTSWRHCSALHICWCCGWALFKALAAVLVSGSLHILSSRLQASLQ